MAYSTICRILGFSNVLRLPIAKAKACTTGRSISMSIRYTRQACMLKAYVAIILLAKLSTWFLHLMPKHPPVDTLAELSSCEAAIAQVQFYNSRLYLISGSYCQRQSARLWTFTRVLMLSVHSIGKCAIIPPCGISKAWLLQRLKPLDLEDVSTAIPQDAPINTQMRKKMESALTRIHSAGCVHGECEKAKVVFLVDFDPLVLESTDEMRAELAAVDLLKTTSTPSSTK